MGKGKTGKPAKEKRERGNMVTFHAWITKETSAKVDEMIEKYGMKKAEFIGIMLNEIVGPLGDEGMDAIAVRSPRSKALLFGYLANKYAQEVKRREAHQPPPESHNLYIEENAPSQPEANSSSSSSANPSRRLDSDRQQPEPK